MTVNIDSLNQVTQVLGRYQRQINLLVVALLCLYLIAYAAELTWRLIPAPDSATTLPAQSQVTTTASQTSNNADISKVQALELFGKVGATNTESKPTVTEAPKTRLNLTLTGVVASNQADAGAAIIENKGTQNTYGVGEKIDGTNAILLEVYPERVIIRNGQRRETLMLDGVESVSASATASRSPRAAQPGSGMTATRKTQPQRRTLSPEAAKSSEALRNKPAAFTDYIAISPYRRNGQLQGYRVSPGRDPSLFKSAGLKSGDIVIEINGLDLTDMQQSMEAMGALREAQSLQLTINRDNEMLTLLLDIPAPAAES